MKPIEKALVFGLKANVAAWLLQGVIAMIVGLALMYGTSFGIIPNFSIDDTFRWGAVVVSCIVSFSSMFIALKIMLKDTKLTNEEQRLALRRTIQVAVFLFLFFAVIPPQKLLNLNWFVLLSFVLSLLASIAPCLIFQRKLE